MKVDILSSHWTWHTCVPARISREKISSERGNCLSIRCIEAALHSRKAPYTSSIVVHWVISGGNTRASWRTLDTCHTPLQGVLLLDFTILRYRHGPSSFPSLSIISEPLFRHLLCKYFLPRGHHVFHAGNISPEPVGDIALAGIKKDFVVRAVPMQGSSTVSSYLLNLQRRWCITAINFCLEWSLWRLLEPLTCLSKSIKVFANDNLKIPDTMLILDGKPLADVGGMT